MIGHDPLLYARSFADVYDDWYGSLDDPQHVVEMLNGRCATDALVIELGSGTGRLATPVHLAGYNVIALDISAPMLRSGPVGPKPLCADMTQLPFAGAIADFVFIAYNTLFNLADRSLQQCCFDEAARVLRPGGVFAVETFIAPSHITAPGDEDSPNRAIEYGLSTRPHPSRAGARLHILTGPDPENADVIVGSHVESGGAESVAVGSGPVQSNPDLTCRPWRLVYQSPAELDACAHRGGLSLIHRSNDWSNTDFDPEGVRHVSWYQRNEFVLR